MSSFRTKHFEIFQDDVAFKFGTDSVILGSWARESFNDKKKEYKILDIGTGCGVLSVMCSQEFSYSKIIAIDIDDRTIQNAQLNFSKSPFKDNIEAIKIDFKELDKVLQFDLIISNPPFFRNSLMGGNELRNSARHQTDLSLEFLLQKSSKHLKKSGKIILILPQSEEIYLERTIKQLGLYCSRLLEISSFKNSPTIRLAYELTNISSKRQTSKIHIYDDLKKYSNEYKSLTSEFYLD